MVTTTLTTSYTKLNRDETIPNGRRASHFYGLVFVLKLEVEENKVGL